MGAVLRASERTDWWQEAKAVFAVEGAKARAESTEDVQADGVAAVVDVVNADAVASTVVVVVAVVVGREESGKGELAVRGCGGRAVPLTSSAPAQRDAVALVVDDDCLVYSERWAELRSVAAAEIEAST